MLIITSFFPVFMDTFMEVRRQIRGSCFSLSTLLGQGLHCVSWSAASWPMSFQVSYLYLMSWQTFVSWLFFFTWVLWLEFSGSGYCFYLQSPVQSSIVWTFCLLWLHFLLSCTVFEQKKEWNFIQNEERITHWWRDENVSSGGGENRNPDVRGSVRLKVESDLWSMIGLCRWLTQSHKILDN